MSSTNIDALERLQARLAAAMADVRQVYEADRNDYDAGRYEGLKEAVAIIEAVQARTPK